MHGEKLIFKKKKENNPTYSFIFYKRKTKAFIYLYIKSPWCTRWYDMISDDILTEVHTLNLPNIKR